MTVKTRSHTLQDTFEKQNEVGLNNLNTFIDNIEEEISDPKYINLIKKGLELFYSGVIPGSNTFLKKYRNNCKLRTYLRTGATHFSALNTLFYINLKKKDNGCNKEYKIGNIELIIILILLGYDFKNIYDGFNSNIIDTNNKFRIPKD